MNSNHSKINFVWYTNLLIPDKIDFKTENVSKNKRTCYDKFSFYQKFITVVNICAPNNKAPKYVKQKVTEMKGEIDNSTMVGDFNIPLLTMDRIRKKIN